MPRGRKDDEPARRIEKSVRRFIHPQPSEPAMNANHLLPGSPVLKFTHEDRAYLIDEHGRLWTDPPATDGVPLIAMTVLRPGSIRLTGLEGAIADIEEEGSAFYAYEPPLRTRMKLDAQTRLQAIEVFAKHWLTTRCRPH